MNNKITTKLTQVIITVTILAILIFISSCVTVETNNPSSTTETNNNNELTGNAVNQLDPSQSSSPDSANFNIKIDLPQTYQQISPGNELWFTTKLVNLANQERIDVTLTYQILDQNRQLQYSKSETVAVETQASFVANLQTPTTLKPGMHYLEVTLSSPFGQSKAETTFTVAKEESEPQIVIKFSLFDIQVEIPEEYKAISPGEELLVLIKLINVGSGGRIDIFLSYWITDQAGNIVLEEKETVAVETQNDFVRKFYLPKDVPAGKYALHAKVSYPGLELEPEYTTNFTVVKNKNPLWLYVLISFLILILILALTSKYTGILSYFEKKYIKKKVENIVKKNKKKKISQKRS